jgi:hypothetical protein
VNWVIVTGAFPPDELGMAELTLPVAEEMAARGENVWIFAGSGPETARSAGAVKVRRFPGHFGLRALAKMSWELRKVPLPRRVLLLYVPQAFGPMAWRQKRRFRGVPLSLCLWLQLLREKVWPVFYVAATPRQPGQSLPGRVLAFVSRWMLRLVLRRSSRVFVGTPALGDAIREVTGREIATEWLPSPSTLPAQTDPVRVAGVRRRLLGEAGTTLLGHFSGYRPTMTDLLRPVIPLLLRGRPERRFLLIGQGSEDFAASCRAEWPDLAPQLTATGGLPAREAAEHIAACELIVETYRPGITTHRTSAMAVLALGSPMVSNAGPWTESLWRDSGAVALAAEPDAGLIAAKVEEVLEQQPRTSEHGSRFYRERFAVERLVDAVTRETASFAVERRASDATAAAPSGAI